MNKQEEIEFFNEVAENWDDKISQENIEVARDFINKLEIGNNKSVLDVGAGTGVLYSILKEKNIKNYLAVDIAEKMIDELLTLHPEVNAKQFDYETKCTFKSDFDFVIIFDSIPHFRKLNIVFENSYKNLKKYGKFIIVHSKTREGLKEHHKKIGYEPDKSPIPSNNKLTSLSKKYGFANIEIKDKEYFRFVCEKR